MILIGFIAYHIGRAQTVDDPSTSQPITLEEGMASIARGLARMYKEKDAEITTGLLPTEVTVSFNVKTTTQAGGKQTLVVGKPEILPTNIGGENNRSKSAEAGNTITFKMQNILYAPKDILLTSKTPQELSTYLAFFSGGGQFLMATTTAPAEAATRPSQPPIVVSEVPPASTNPASSSRSSGGGGWHRILMFRQE